MSGWHRPARDLEKTVQARTEYMLHLKIESYKNGGWQQVGEVKKYREGYGVKMRLANRKGAKTG